jgi:translation initiation factor 3 subunit M
MNVPVFIDISLEEQAEELRAWMKGQGAEISEERSEIGLEEDLQKIISVCDVSFKDASEADVEGILNGIVSMLALCSGDKTEALILAFCEKLSKAPNQEMSLVCLKVLWSLFQSLSESSSMRFHVYYYLAGIAGRTGQLDTVYKDIPATNKLFTKAPLTIEQRQRLYRLLHEVLLANSKANQAGKVMVDLLGTYTTENASEAKEEAQRCIVASLADPNTFLFDHLLNLKPVKFLEGQLIHDLLKIFVFEKLEAYIKFFEANKDFVTGLGLKHEDNVRKMKLLSFMQLAENRSEVSFAEIQHSIQIGEDEVEEFLIDVIKTKLVRAKIAQGDNMVHVSSTMHRTFGPGDWQQLHQLLTQWKSNIHTVKEQMQHVASAQVDLMHKKI